MAGGACPKGGVVGRALCQHGPGRIRHLWDQSAAVLTRCWFLVLLLGSRMRMEYCLVTHMSTLASRVGVPGGKQIRIHLGISSKLSGTSSFWTSVALVRPTQGIKQKKWATELEKPMQWSKSQFR